MTLSAPVAGALLSAFIALPAHAQHTETEPNQDKPAANAITMAPGETLSGGGDNENDYFRITTAPAPALPGTVYRYTLRMTGGVGTRTMSIRGLTQAGGVIAPASDATYQSSSTAVLW